MFSERRRRRPGSPLAYDPFNVGSSYTGQVATNSRLPTNLSGINKQANARTHHFARDNITSLQIQLGNWAWLRGTTKVETAGGGNITYTASIEYPAGTFTQVKFSGANSAVVASGSQVLSDAVAVQIPRGAEFWVRTYAVAVTAIVFTDSNTGFAQRDLSHGEAYEYGPSGITDKTMSGTLTDNGAASAPIFVPEAIVATTKRPTFLFIGDSRTWGFNDNYDGLGVAIGNLGRYIGQRFGFINMGSPGDSYAGFNAGNTHRAGLQQYASHVVIAGGINSLRAAGENKSAATVLGEQQTTIGLFAGKKIITATVEPVTSSAGNWTAVNGSDQTLDANSAAITTYNQAIRAGVSGAAGYFELANPLSTAVNSQKWLANGVANAYTLDGLHTTQLGYNLLANSPASYPETLLKRP